MSLIKTPEGMKDSKEKIFLPANVWYLETKTLDHRTNPSQMEILIEKYNNLYTVDNEKIFEMNSEEFTRLKFPRSLRTDDQIRQLKKLFRYEKREDTFFINLAMILPLSLNYKELMAAIENCREKNGF